MFHYGKTTQNAIAIMSRLAECYNTPHACVSSIEIAESRGLTNTLTAKLLTKLSHAGLVSGARGPGGGYTLATTPDKISLLDIAEVFERTSQPSVCPLGVNHCQRGASCPLHDQLMALDQLIKQFLQNTTLGVFTENPRALDYPHDAKS